MRIVLLATLLLGYRSGVEPCTEVGIEVGQCAPTLTLPAASGESWSLADREGQVVFVQLATSWCGICQERAAPQQELGDEYAAEGFEKVTVLKGDVNYGSVDQDEAAEWAAYFALSHPVLYDKDRAV
jgi:thiol-disulfide isomerase/thioredoxin